MQAGHVVFGAMEEVVFGRPTSDALIEQLDRVGSQRVLLMVSGTLNRDTDEIERIRGRLDARVCAMFDTMPAHTPREAVIAATTLAREAGADSVVTIGGGSITDGAKAVQLCMANDIGSVDAMDRIKGGMTGIKPPTVRQISIPTTIAGGEFSAIAGVTNMQTKVKEGFRHPLIIPRAVILDPAITVHTPEWLWLSTGIRAVDHCVEGLCSGEAHPYGDAQAQKGLAMLAHALPRVKADPGDLNARLNCQIGTWLSMGALSAGVPMGASHGIGYVLGAAFGVPHGHTSCVMLPAAMRWNETANADRQALVADAMGQPGKNAADVLDRFIGDLGMPRTLRAVGVVAKDFPLIAKQAMGTPWVPRNPRPIAGPDDVMQILELAA